MSRRAPGSQPKPSTTGRTVVLVAVASAVAAFILGRGLAGNNNKPSTNTGNSGSKTTTTLKGATNTTLALPTTPTTATPPTIAPPSVKVVVLNGNRKKGTAGARTNELKALGYNMLVAADASGSAVSQMTAVYYAAATDQPAAAQIATLIGAAAPTAMPATPPADAAKLTGANVIVLLGVDLADKAIGAAAPTATTAPPVATTPAITAKPPATTTTVKK